MIKIKNKLQYIRKLNLITMAKAKGGSGDLRTHLKKPKVKRKGIGAKSKTSKNKRSKNYKKPYKSQGR